LQEVMAGFPLIHGVLRIKTKGPSTRGLFVVPQRGRRESNPRNQFGRLRLYH
jgi:hypothetical protein